MLSRARISCLTDAAGRQQAARCLHSTAVLTRLLYGYLFILIPPFSWSSRCEGALHQTKIMPPWNLCCFPSPVNLIFCPTTYSLLVIQRHCMTSLFLRSVCRSYRCKCMQKRKLNFAQGKPYVKRCKSRLIYAHCSPIIKVPCIQS